MNIWKGMEESYKKCPLCTLCNKNEVTEKRHLMLCPSLTDIRKQESELVNDIYIDFLPFE